ncbi:hypothetical protein Q8F55_008652 [Vanrija albida]|uniref:Uncharacterized protein n=1 Tax=Vanrija albida TaxID=181172 RepID=A0ABR3PRE6_9TREE
MPFTTHSQDSSPNVATTSEPSTFDYEHALREVFHVLVRYLEPKDKHDMRLVSSSLRDAVDSRPITGAWLERCPRSAKRTPILTPFDGARSILMPSSDRADHVRKYVCHMRGLRTLCITGTPIGPNGLKALLVPDRLRLLQEVMLWPEADSEGAGDGYLPDLSPLFPKDPEQAPPTLTISCGAGALQGTISPTPRTSLKNTTILIPNSAQHINLNYLVEPEDSYVGAVHPILEYAWGVKNKRIVITFVPTGCTSQQLATIASNVLPEGENNLRRRDWLISTLFKVYEEFGFGVLLNVKGLRHLFFPPLTVNAATAAGADIARRIAARLSPLPTISDDWEYSIRKRNALTFDMIVDIFPNPIDHYAFADDV